MKNIIIFCLANSLFAVAAFGQNTAERTAFTTGELKMGYGITRFGNGLKEAYEAGNFGTSGGGLYVLSVHRKFAKIPFLQLGLKFKALGAGPATGNDGDEMFFNYWSFGGSVKYYPLDQSAQKGFVVYGDYLFVSQFTQKYRNVENKEFDHQFAIGSAFNAGIGYDFPLGSQKPVISVGIEFESARRQGEVTGVGDKIFQNTNIGFLVGLRF